MTTISSLEFCKRAAFCTVILAPANAAVSASMAWGTKFINQIPTQNYASALIAAPIHSFTTSIVALGVSLLAEGAVINYFLNGRHNPTKEEKDEAKRKFFIISKIISFSIATLLTIITLPMMGSLVHKTISYKEAAAFAMIDNFTTLITIYLLI